MRRRTPWRSCSFSATSRILAGAIAMMPSSALSQKVSDGSDAAIGKENAHAVLALVAQNLKNVSDARVTSLRRSKNSIICGSINVKGPDGRYLGERGFVVDLARDSFGRVPDGPELLSPRSAGFEKKERVRQLYFNSCLD